MTNQKINTFIKSYTKALRQKNAVIFAGAGLSKASGFVDWKGLLRDIAEDLGLDIDKEHDLVAITQFHINEKGGNRSRINQILIDKFTRDSVMTENHRLLARMPIEIYWTSNYDKLIEEALSDAGKTPDVKISQPNLAISRPKSDAIVYKMHGDISQPHEAIISKDDYELYSEHRALFSTALKGDLVSKTFLFIGFSFDDPNLNQILARVRALLGTNQREHFCFFKRVSKDSFSNDQEYEYSKIKQDLIIKDLKRYSIEGLLVDDYSQITEILSRIRDSFRRNVIFISGSADDYGKWDNELAQKFVHSLAYKLVSEEFKIVSGFGKGIGSIVINGCLEYIFSSKNRHLDEYLELRPFPQVSTGAKSLQDLRKEYREYMISSAGIAIFLFGNKLKHGKLVDADGLYKEFQIAKNMGIKLVPIGATGFVAKALWQKVLDQFDSLYPDYPHLKKDFEILGKENEKPETIINKIVKIVNTIRGVSDN
ncbi:MAG: SIR2 family protein [Dehalococcoidia bacterium]|nr:SIR2 family protein [Dehalococcoidia bacterium]MDD5493801.1 SIR2 family protein [Dehalococcoidia bacterium]